MAKRRNNPQVDLEDAAGAPEQPRHADDRPSDLDVAANTVRKLLSGRASLAAVRDVLEGLTADELAVLSIMTRLPVSRLETLKDS